MFAAKILEDVAAERETWRRLMLERVAVYEREASTKAQAALVKRHRDWLGYDKPIRLVDGNGKVVKECADSTEFAYHIGRHSKIPECCIKFYVHWCGKRCPRPELLSAVDPTKVT